MGFVIAQALETGALMHLVAAAIANMAVAIGGPGGFYLPLIRHQPSCLFSSSASEEGLATE